MTPRIIPAGDRSPGLTEITRDGRTFQTCSDTPEALAELEAFAAERVGDVGGNATPEGERHV